MRTCIAVFLSLIVGTSLLGCAKARLVEVTQEGGVVAIPANTNRWPNYYRKQAEALIAEKYPEGYEIVEEEEVVTGQIAHTQSRTETKQAPSLNIGGFQDNSKNREDDSVSFAGLSIPLVKDEQETQQTTNYRDVTEYRIRFRPKTQSGTPLRGVEN